MSNTLPTIGNQCKLVWMSAGSWASPTWTVVEVAKDVQTNVTRAEVVCAYRGVDEEFTRSGQKKFEISCKLAHLPTNAAYEAIRDALLNGTSIVVAALTAGSAVVGAEGPKMKAEVFSHNRGEALNSPVEIDLVFKPNGEETTVWLEVAA